MSRVVRILLTGFEITANPMMKIKTIMNFEGSISFESIEMLLNKLRSAPEFQDLKKPVRKRLYGIFVESIDNIFKYTARIPTDGLTDIRDPMISVRKLEDAFLITAGNMVPNDDIDELRFKLDRVNQLDNEALKTLYEDVINQESGSDDKGAGLGLITMALRTDKKINYSFTALEDDYSFFEIQLTINE